MKAWYLAAILTAFAGAAACGGSAGAIAAPQAEPVPESGRPIVIGRSFTLPSKLLKDDRRINVYLPEHYDEPGRTFPVLFLLDGGEREDFLHIAALAQITAAYGQGQEMIVVGIEGVDRRHDLTSPSSVAEDLKRAPTSGGAATYRRFLAEELKPWVAARYRTSGQTAIIGESLAGLFVLETFLKQPGSFEDFIAVSPSLWWNGGKLAREAGADLRKAGFSGRRLWIGFETPPPPADEAARERALQAALEAALRAVQPPGLAWTAVHLEEGHGNVYHPAALQALRSLYAVKPGGK
jgi:hypothetical protein